MWPEFPFFSRKDRVPEGPVAEEAGSAPVLNLSLDRKVYRPGDAVTATVEICRSSADALDSIHVEEIVVEVRGTEKLDPQWIVTSKPSPGTKLKRGERVFLESRGTIVTGVFVEGNSTKSYLVRTTLPKVLPPSFRGTAVRYFYYVTAKVRWKFISAENGILNGTSSRNAALPLEKRIALTVWTLPTNSGLTADELQLKESYGNGGIVPTYLVEMEMEWKENNAFLDWSRTSSFNLGIEDDVSSQGSESFAQSPVKGNIENTFDRMILQSPLMTPKKPTPRKTTLMTASFSDTHLAKEQRLVQRSVSGNWSPWNKSGVDGYHSEQEDDSRIESPAGHIKGKAYNIRLEDEILVRISPKNPDAIHYFGDTVAGVVSFPNGFHDDIGLRKCLEVSAVLEVREVLNPSHLHPSRKNSQVITKVQSEYHEVVSDMSQTHYLFSIPLDGPASFSTPHVTVQWILRFEFLSTQASFNLSNSGHPLQIKERDRGVWAMPITVHAPLPRTAHGGGRKDRPVSSLRDFWIQSPKASDWTPQGSPVQAGPSNGHL